MPEWTLDEYGYWNIHHEHVHIWLGPRPAYCDRGHWLGGVDGIGSIDGADMFPRYYMDLDRAKAEMRDWLEWRLRCIDKRKQA